MNYKYLLMESKRRLHENPEYISGAISSDIFSTGAKWMRDRLNENCASKINFNPTIAYGAYGLLKYIFCSIAFISAACLLYKVHIVLVPLSVFIFYFFEVQFLFLFPLLIDQVPNPLWISIQQTWRIGIFKAMRIVIPISIFMIFGLFKFGAPLRNWHTGSLAIIIWYQHEVRNRIQ